MQGYVERMIAEKTNFSQKWEKLRDFINSDKYDSLDGENKSLLSAQFNIMGAYLCILERRIDINARGEKK